MIADQTISPPTAEGFARWVDPDSGEEFVLVPVEQYERIRKVLDGFTTRTGWDDSAMDDYEAFRKKT